MLLSNTLTRNKEEFKPVNSGKVGIYSCGPTVYWNQHIGHMYAYVQWDTMIRAFRYLGYEVKWVMNITDVGHMTSDEDSGEDKMEKGAKREGLGVWQLADKYILQFKDSMSLLNITPPDTLCRATEHIDEQIDLAKKIENNGFTYTTKGGLVYNTSKFPDYAKFANLKLDSQEKREDVSDDPEKKNSSDFYLWVTGNPNHIMKWNSPWGEGYPGWHLECTAMSVKYLGENFDIHTGGIEHIGVHHTDEIAQGFGAFGKQTANYWLHNAWLTLVGGEKMSKSLGNFVTVQELAEKGYDPLALRYLILNSHYKKGLQFSFDTLDSAQKSLNNLREIVVSTKTAREVRSTVSPDKLAKADAYKEAFTDAISDDINAPKALSVLWEMLKSNIPSQDKYDLALDFDEVLGLKLSDAEKFVDTTVPESIKKLAQARVDLRKIGKYAEADEIRKSIEDKGFVVKDTSDGFEIKPTK